MYESMDAQFKKLINELKWHEKNSNKVVCSKAYADLCQFVYNEQDYLIDMLERSKAGDQFIHFLTLFYGPDAKERWDNAEEMAGKIVEFRKLVDD